MVRLIRGPKDSEGKRIVFATSLIDKDAYPTQSIRELYRRRWNIETMYRCSILKPSKSRLKAGEPFTVTAVISNTFLDGSRVALHVDGRPADAKWAWARGDRRDELAFEVSLRERGPHDLSVADRTVEINVE